MMATKRDYYALLGVAREASADDIKKAYRKLAAKYLTDLKPVDQSVIDRFKEAAEAFEILSHDEKHARYDRFGHAGVQGGAAGGGGQFHDVQDIFEAFGGIFGDQFGNQGGRRGRGGSRAR